MWPTPHLCVGPSTTRSPPTVLPQHLPCSPRHYYSLLVLQAVTHVPAELRGSEELSPRSTVMTVVHASSQREVARIINRWVGTQRRRERVGGCVLSVLSPPRTRSTGLRALHESKARVASLDQCFVPVSCCCRGNGQCYPHRHRPNRAADNPRSSSTRLGGDDIDNVEILGTSVGPLQARFRTTSNRAD